MMFWLHWWYFLKQFIAEDIMRRPQNLKKISHSSDCCINFVTLQLLSFSPKCYQGISWGPHAIQKVLSSRKFLAEINQWIEIQNPDSQEFDQQLSEMQTNFVISSMFPLQWNLQIFRLYFCSGVIGSIA